MPLQASPERCQALGGRMLAEMATERNTSDMYACESTSNSYESGVFPHV